MSDDDDETDKIVEAVEILQNMEKTNAAVAKLIDDFENTPTAGDTAAIREFQDHRNTVVLRLILNQQKQIRDLQIVLTRFAIESTENRQILQSLLKILTAQASINNSKDTPEPPDNMDK